MKKSNLTQKILMRKAIITSLMVALLGILSVASAREIVADSAKSNDEEEVFSLAGFGNTHDTRDGEDETGSSVWDNLTNNLRFDIEMVNRFSTTRRRGKVSGFNTIGFDLHKVFTDEHGDIGTLLLQLHIARRDNAFPTPHHVEDDDDWEVEFHDFHFNLTRWGRGRTNFKIGRFAVPFGLEPNSETHLTLYQTIAHENLGLKKDWGFSINGQLPKFDYEVAITQASGHEIWNVGKNYAVAARIGTPSEKNLVLGLSAFHGQVMDEHRIHRWRSGLREMSRVDRVLGRTPDKGRGEDNLVRRTRFGIDVFWVNEQYTLKGELSVGRDFNQDVVNSLVEIDWRSADESLHAYLQGIYLGQRGSGWDKDIEARIGMVWVLDPHFEISAQYSQDLKTYGDRPTDSMFTIQSRIRF